MKKFIFATDLHGDMQDYESVEALLKFCDIWQPDLKVFGGDLFDFRNIRIGASQGEKQESMASDVEAGLQFLNDFKPNVFLLGNHDKRLWDTAHFNESGIIADYAKQGVKDINAKCRKLKCKIVEYKADKGYYDFGKVRFIHGYHAGIYATKNTQKFIAHLVALFCMDILTQYNLPQSQEFMEGKQEVLVVWLI